MRNRVEVYMRLRKNHSEKVDCILATFDPDCCLDEIEVLAQALRPAYMSITVIGGGMGSQWAGDIRV